MLHLAAAEAYPAKAILSCYARKRNHPRHPHRSYTDEAGEGAAEGGAGAAEADEEAAGGSKAKGGKKPTKESAIAKKLREQLEARRKAEEEAERCSCGVGMRTEWGGVGWGGWRPQHCLVGAGKNILGM